MGYREQFSQIADRVLAAFVHPAQFLLLLDGELRLLATELPLRSCDGHPLADAQTDQVGFEFRERRRDVEGHLAHWVGRIVDA